MSYVMVPGEFCLTLHIHESVFSHPDGGRQQASLTVLWFTYSHSWPLCRKTLSWHPCSYMLVPLKAPSHETLSLVTGMYIVPMWLSWRYISWSLCGSGLQLVTKEKCTWFERQKWRAALFVFMLIRSMYGPRCSDSWQDVCSGLAEVS